MRILYNLVFVVFSIVYFPYLIVTKRYRYGMAERFGFLSRRLRAISSSSKVIWIHAVSLGEMKAASILAPLLRRTFPKHTLVFSSVTHTGNKVARTIATADEGVFYLPLDVSFITDRVARIIKPELFLLLEAELWPNLINSLYKANTKIILVNGRVSDSSYRDYKRIGFIMPRILNKISLMLMQSGQDAAKMLELGAPKENIFVTGNLKFDLSLSDSVTKNREVREKLGIRDEDILFTAGSTNKGEEEQLVDCFSRLKKDYRGLRFLIAPRHIERTQEIQQLIDRKGFKSARYSQIKDLHLTHEDILILDTIGDLKVIYSGSDIVFVGGSLIEKRGGQNPIEPASLAKPIIMGRFMANYQDVVRAFLENHAAIQVEDRDGLYSALKLLLDNPGERRNLGMNAREIVDRNSGSSQRTISLILSHLKS